MPTATTATTSATAKTGQQLAASVRSKGYSYDRALCKAFQTAAGISADGLYGPATKKALAALGIDAPSNLFVGAGQPKVADLVRVENNQQKTENNTDTGNFGTNGLIIIAVLVGAYLVFRK